jgi:Integrase zinc binding domain
VPRSLAEFAAATETAYSDMPEPMVDLLRTTQCGDGRLRRSKLLSQGMEAEHSPWSLTEDGLLRFKGYVYVQKDAAIRAEIIRTHHDDPQGVHFGEKRTIDTIQRKYYWQGLPGEVKNYVHTCQGCQKHQVIRHKPHGSLERVARVYPPRAGEVKLTTLY